MMELALEVLLFDMEDDHDPNLPDPRESPVAPDSNSSSFRGSASGFGGASFPSGLELHELAKMLFLEADELSGAGGCATTEGEVLDEVASSAVGGGVIGEGGLAGGDDW